MHADVIWENFGVQCVYSSGAKFECIIAITNSVYEQLRVRPFRYLIQNFSHLQVSIAGSASYLTIIAPALAHDLGNTTMKTAIICSNYDMFEMLEICLPQTEDKVGIFVSLDEARQWLGDFE